MILIYVLNNYALKFSLNSHIPNNIMCQSYTPYFTQKRIKVESMAGTVLCPKVNYGPQFDDSYETHNSLTLLVGDFVIFNFSQSVE